jgi:hypothetical protein
MFADELLGPVRQWGYLVKDLDEAMQVHGALGYSPVIPEHRTAAQAGIYRV